MKPAPFLYAQPRRVTDAVELLARPGRRARLLAGGQSLLPLLCRRSDRPDMVIDINRIPGLDQIELLPTLIRMGALVRQQQALKSSIIRAQVAGVAEALAWVANPVVRQRGTVVGNLVANSPGAELPAVALALGAQFVLQYPHGEDTVSAAALLGADRTVPVNAMVTHVLWPRRAGAVGFYEVARRDGHAPVVSAMVTVSEGNCRVAVSGVCATGLSCHAMARMIARKFPRVPAPDELAAALQDDLTGPIYADTHSSARYRLAVAPIVTQRAAQSMALQVESGRAGQP